jgi:hypothetical protein
MSPRSLTTKDTKTTQPSIAGRSCRFFGDSGAPRREEGGWLLGKRGRWLRLVRHRQRRSAHPGSYNQRCTYGAPRFAAVHLPVHLAGAGMRGHPEDLVLRMRATGRAQPRRGARRG